MLLRAASCHLAGSRKASGTSANDRPWPKLRTGGFRSGAGSVLTSAVASNYLHRESDSPEEALPKIRERARVGRGMSAWVREQAALKGRLRRGEQQLIDLAVELSNREAARIHAEDAQLLNAQKEKGLAMEPSPFEYFGTYVSYEKTQSLHNRARPFNAWPTLLTITGINGLIYLLFTWADGAPPPPDGGMPQDMQTVRDHFIGSLHNISEGRWWTALTCTFAHADLGHLSGNLLAFWMFGFKVAQVLGPARFWTLYLFGGVLATCGELYSGAIREWAEGIVPSFRAEKPAEPTKQPAESTEQPVESTEKPVEPTEQESIEKRVLKRGVLGASGSVMAISAAAMVLFPSDCIRVQIPALTIVLPLAVTFYMVGDVLGVLLASSHIAHFAHLTGALVGIIMTSIFWKTSKRVPPKTLLPVVRYIWEGISKVKKKSR